MSNEENLLKSVIDVIKEIPQQPQAQYDLEQQLRELRIAANKLGLYDASDFIRPKRELSKNELVEKWWNNLTFEQKTSNIIVYFGIEHLDQNITYTDIEKIYINIFKHDKSNY